MSWRNDAFELWCWWRLSRVPWTAWRSNQSILKENQPWIFVGRTDAEAEAPILWPPDVKSHLTGKDPDAGKAWGQEEKGMTEDEMVGWHHWLNGHEFEQTPGESAAWCNAVHEVTKSQTRLSNCTITMVFYYCNNSYNNNNCMSTWNLEIPMNWSLIHMYTYIFLVFFFLIMLFSKWNV